MHLTEITLFNQTGSRYEQWVPLFAIKLPGGTVRDDMIIDVSRKLRLMDERAVVEVRRDLGRELLVEVHGEANGDDGQRPENRYVIGINNSNAG